MKPVSGVLCVARCGENAGVISVSSVCPKQPLCSSRCKLSRKVVPDCACKTLLEPSEFKPLSFFTTLLGSMTTEGDRVLLLGDLLLPAELFGLQVCALLPAQEVSGRELKVVSFSRLLSSRGDSEEKVADESP